MLLIPTAISVNVTTAGTRVQVTATSTLVRKATFRARTGNAGVIYLGGSTVAVGAGYQMAAGNVIEVELTNEHGRSMIFDLAQFWVDASANGDDVDVFYMAEG